MCSNFYLPRCKDTLVQHLIKYASCENQVALKQVKIHKGTNILEDISREARHQAQYCLTILIKNCLFLRYSLKNLRA